MGTLMIDLHCHILPNVDDGPDSLELSLKMLKQAQSQGIEIQERPVNELQAGMEVENKEGYDD